MLASMTGYGFATNETPDLIVRVEIKSLNSRNLDMSIRVPKAYSEKEISLRSQLSARLQRGKISIYIETELLNGRVAKKAVNRGLLLSYYNEIKAVAEEAGEPTAHIFPSLLGMSDIMQPAQTEATEDEWPLVENTLNQALEKFEEFRLAEGKVLQAELISYIENIRKSLSKVDEQKDRRIEKIRNDLTDKLQSLLDEGRVDQNRFEQELIFYAEKLDITEEIVRLTSHLNYFNATIQEEYPGKKLGFIAQEIGREINTIGAKANDAAIQKDIVLMKEELEKIKEQVLNIL
jgi:uncharacterized protein (TIGR00255 family)